MNGKMLLVGAAILLTLTAVVTWLATGRHAYTAYEAVEERQVAVSGDDPLAETGFYDGEVRTERVWRDVFHFGLLPTSRGVIDKHALSVLSVAFPPWAAALGVILLKRRRERKRAGYAAVEA